MWGIWGPHHCGLAPGAKPCSLKREGPGLLSFPPQLLAFCARSPGLLSCLVTPVFWPLSAFGGVPDL